MIKHVNFTGRRRISRSHVSIEVFDGEPRSFDASIDLTGFETSDDAAVVLEATCAGSSVVSRFEWGTAANLSPPDNRTLTELSGRNVFFTLKVIDRSEQVGRILGFAENIRPIKGGAKTETGRRGILPVEQVDLGDEVWRLEFRSEDVFLLVNERIPDLADRVRFDPSTYALIYPSIIREVLGRAIEEDIDPEDDDESWAALWMKFAGRLIPEHSSPPVAEAAEVQQEWIDEVVTAFCREHSLRHKLAQAMASGTGWEDLA